ncbi:hypothetical protein FISHEDRAFT_69865 [Fistulina hepatica ATCC 64428]|uniref:Uncharacterized protein n=1 Tax=Fistulina hepatica ATCC 64428 TaxID=1128425 RepID=A0A0D7ALJ9_9AGAR|nr:hypothetical protein FISHEDRAFT_69865 [Fistulina hepatica ATCC 64428]
MPHKRAKRSVREEEHKQKGFDAAPGKDALSTEAIPKSIARVLNAQKIREQYRARKRAMEEHEEKKEDRKRRRVDSKDKNTLGIRPGEALTHFNKRVEDDMRPAVKSAMHAAARRAEPAEKPATGMRCEGRKKPLRGVIESTVDDHEAPKARVHERPKEFERISTSQPRRLNDIVQAPPELKPPRKAAREKTKSSRTAGVVSMKQKLMMEEQRELAIARYRELKAMQRETIATMDDPA